jgi:hypothetical protein
VHDDIDAPLLDDHAHPFAGLERDLVAVIVAAKQPPFDRLARLEAHDIRQPAGRQCPGCRDERVRRRGVRDQRRRSGDEDANGCSKARSHRVRRPAARSAGGGYWRST